MANESSRRRGWRWDDDNSHLEIEVNGTKIAHLSSGGLALVAGADLDFEGTTGQNELTLTDNLADALSLKISGGNDLMIFTTTNSAEKVAVVPALFSINGVGYSWPSAGASAGEQLQSTACDVLTWESAASLREFKNIMGDIEPIEGLQRILDLDMYEFQYKTDSRRSTGCKQKVYTGFDGDTAQWAMHHNGISGKREVLDPISTFGTAALAIQALASKVDELEARL